jgi:hypothetical protein
MATARNLQQEMQAQQNEKMLEHIDTILRFAVFGVGQNRKSDWQRDGGALVMSMSGFVEQKGRLPRPDDPVEMVYLAGNGIKRWMEVRKFRADDRAREQFVLTSECCLIAK